MLVKRLVEPVHRSHPPTSYCQ